VAVALAVATVLTATVLAIEASSTTAIPVGPVATSGAASRREKSRSWGIGDAATRPATAAKAKAVERILKSIPD
jgi:hypothetical protein